MQFLFWDFPPYTLALIGLIWYACVVTIIAIGTFQLCNAFLRSTPRPHSLRLPLDCVPHVTIIRPVDGRDPLQRACLVSTFQQNYPAARLTVYFCVAKRSDPAHPLLQKLVAEHPAFDARVFVEEEDANLHGKNGAPGNLGPNPKIRNMSAAYRAAKGEIMWIVDSNVWVSAGACGLMVDQLCGFRSAGEAAARKYKFVHQLPLAVDVSGHVADPSRCKSRSSWGAALDELFLATAHAKFYIGISAVAIAPCTVGKSNMFRRYHLDALTPSRRSGRSAGIDFFSENICEDHLIGDLLWKREVPIGVQKRAALEGKPPAPPPAKPAPGAPLPLGAPEPPWRNHAIVINPPCIQPLAHVALGPYVARRARWLRVRKFTVPAATAVEPGTESLLASACLATAATNVPWFRAFLGLRDASWAAWATVFALGVLAWAVLDYLVWRMLQGWAGEGAISGWEAVRDKASRSSKPLGGQAGKRKGFAWWAAAWAGREVLALPVWSWAVLGGTTVRWRGRRFKVGMDAQVREVDEGKKRK